MRESVSVTVLGVKGNQVRLGISAPKNLAVQREGTSARIDPVGTAVMNQLNAENDEIEGHG